MKKYFLLLVLLVSVSCFSQTVNDYQYVIVPTKFTGFKDNDKYRLNTTAKMMLEKYGFKAYFATDNIPMEVGGNCDRLYADLAQEKDIFSTKVKLVLKDCKENVIYETEYGKSREKEYSKAYNEALRETAKSFDKLNYKYNGKTVPSVEITQVHNQEAPVTHVESISPVVDNNEPFYFAQPTVNGYQVVDNEPKVMMRLFNTSQKNVFIATKGNSNGVVINKSGQWFFEYYENAKLVSEPLKLKF